MKARIDAGSDVAMIGAWDAQRDSKPLTEPELKRLSDTLEADAAAGHLFLLRTGADGGGPVDLYIDETIPSAIRDRLVLTGSEFLLLLPSGGLVVAGAEDYRSANPKVAGAKSSVTVPAGDYALRCYVPRDDEQSPRSEDALRKLVGRADLEYYDRINTVGCVAGALTLLLLPILWFPFGWKAALVITVIVFVSFFPAREWVLKRNPRYQRLNEVVPTFRLRNQDPAFVLELRQIQTRAGLKGGWVSL